MSVDAHDIMHLNTKSRPVKCLGGRVKGGGREEGGGRVEGGGKDEGASERRHRRKAEWGLVNCVWGGKKPQVLTPKNVPCPQP